MRCEIFVTPNSQCRKKARYIAVSWEGLLVRYVCANHLPKGVEAHLIAPNTGSHTPRSLREPLGRQGAYMSLYEKVVKELSYGMNMPNATDVAFVSLWVSRRDDGSLSPTMCHIEEEPLTDELRERIAIVLRNLADTVCPTMRAPDPPSALVCTCGLSEHYKTLHVPPCPLAGR